MSIPNPGTEERIALSKDGTTVTVTIYENDRLVGAAVRTLPQGTRFQQACVDQTVVEARRNHG